MKIKTVISLRIENPWTAVTEHTENTVLFTFTEYLSGYSYSFL